MKRFLLVLACLTALAGATSAQNVTISVDAGQLQNSTGTMQEPVGGLLQLIASPSGTFSAPTSTSYTTGDNVVVANFAMNNNGGIAEVFTTFTSLPLATSNYTLTAGEALTLRFYPSLTLASMPSAPTLATTYGQVRSNTIEFGTAGGVPSETAWVVPSAGSTVNLEYVTVSNGGTYSNISADASSIVLAGNVPEPSAGILSGLGLVVAAGAAKVWRRRSLVC